MTTNKSYLEIMTKAPVYEVPHLWDSVFLDDMAKIVKEPFKFGYKRGQIESNGARVSVMEPNISISKNCMLPILIGEEAYRHHPDLVKHIYLCNTYDKTVSYTHLIGGASMGLNIVFGIDTTTAAAIDVYKRQVLQPVKMA